jgi:hypothetical protein
MTELNDPVNPWKTVCTVCTGDYQNNIWYQARADGFAGRCILDELTYADVYDVLLRVPGAAEDLARITSDPRLLMLAREVKVMVPEITESERVAKRINGSAPPFYTVLRGNTDGSVLR